MAYSSGGFGNTKQKNLVEIPKLKDLASLAAPEAIEDEWGVMSCIMSSQKPQEIFLTVASILEPKHFALPLLQDIWRIMLKMHSEHLPINYSVFQCYLEDFEQKNEAFFQQLLPKMYESTHDEDCVKYYAERILTKYHKRSLMHVFSEGIASATSHMLPEDALVEVERKLSAVRQELHHKSKKSGSSLSSLLDNYLIDLKEQADGTRASGTINTQNWYDFNQASQGFAPGDFIVIAAPTSCGKSMTGIGMAREFAMAGSSVLYASLEMTQRTVLERIMAPVIGFSAGAMTRTGQISEQKLASIRKFQEEHANLPISIKKPHHNSYDSFLKSAAEAEAEMREQQGDDFKGFRVVIVDYLQLLAANVPSQFKVQEIDRVSQLLRNYALENDCTVIALAQYDTETAKSGKEPDSLNCLSYCKTIDHHATQVIMMWHPYFADRKKLHDATYIDFLWMKNRDGSNDRVRMGIDWSKGWLFSLTNNQSPHSEPQVKKDDPWQKLAEKYGEPAKKPELPEVELDPIALPQSSDPALALAMPKGADVSLNSTDALQMEPNEAEYEDDSEALAELIDISPHQAIAEPESATVMHETSEVTEAAVEASEGEIVINGEVYHAGDLIPFSPTTDEEVTVKLVRMGDYNCVVVQFIDSARTIDSVRNTTGKEWRWKEGDQRVIHPSRFPNKRG